MKRGLALIALLVAALHLPAQNSLYQFDHLDSRNGLSNNQVNTIFKDDRGFVWFGTMSGLNRYDGYSFKVFRHRLGDPTSINDDYINSIVQGPHHTLWVYTPDGWNIFDPLTETFSANIQAYVDTTGAGTMTFSSIVRDRQGNFWFVYPGRGLYKYTTSRRKTAHYHSGSRELPLHSNNVNAAVTDSQGYLWVVYGDGMLEKLETTQNKVIYRSDLLRPYTPAPTVSYRLFADKDNDIWIFPKGDSRGVFYLKPSQNTLLSIHKDAKDIRVNNNLINAVTQDDKGLIWIATDHGGVNLLDKKDFSVKWLVNNENDPKSISQNSVTTLHRDYSGIIWVGTYKRGANQFHESNVRFPLFQRQAGNRKGLMYNDVNKFVEDRAGNLWIGANGGGLIYFDRAKNSFKQYLHDAADAASLSNNIIVSLFIDREDKLWIGTYFGGLDCFDGKKFTHYRHDDKNPASLADDRVWEIFEDSRRRLWVGTLREGLEQFDRKEQQFIHYKPGKTDNTLHSSYVCSIIEDRQGDIWIGTAYGIDVLDGQTGAVRHFEHREGDGASLSHNNTIELLQDSRGLIWVATRDGLNVYNPVKKRFTAFRMDDGLPDNSILTVVEDNHHQIWVTTPNGISGIAVIQDAAGEISLRCKNYDETDGLQSRQFNENAALKTRAGEIVVGGANGFNIFQPAAGGGSRAMPKLILTDLQIFNNSVQIGAEYDGKMVLPQAITEAKEITLTYSQNVFTVEFSALEFLNADKIKYAYKLQGFNKEWLTTDAKARKATFTNLGPGAYTLLIRASNTDGEWSNEPLSLSIRVLPPIWLTTYAFIAYALLLVAALFYGRRLILRRARARFDLERERQEAHRLHELDMMKIRFFTNVSHEFRTPLSLIISPVEKMINASAEKDKNQLQLIHRNARRLLNLVNQLLDFRKMEEQELRLNKTSGDIIQFIREICASFFDLAENKKIAFAVQASEACIFTGFDHDKLERILFNLLSNAFKFTPVGGAVHVVVETLAAPAERLLQITVTDTGIGIARDMQEKIFERFFQNAVPGSMVNQGSGIGLAITREFVRMHGGTITVESEADKGSSFVITLPLTPIEIDHAGIKLYQEPSMEQPGEEPVPIPVSTAGRKNAQGRKKTVLLVEDNDDFRFYIRENLKAFYTILEARNGKLGWQKALAGHPDLVVCDISMPEMNGIELCRKIKADDRTSFIPVLLLTAVTGEEQQLAGLQTGANDYMTKPFNFEILLSKIRNLLQQQESFKKTYQKQVQAVPTELPAEGTADEKFMQQVLAAIEKNISNPDFSVEELSRGVFMSRVALYKKLLALSGKPPLEFIRSLRLQRAARLLQKKELTVAEVAYEVGFNNPKYFSRFFKAEFGVLPSVYASEEDAAGEK